MPPHEPVARHLSPPPHAETAPLSLMLAARPHMPQCEHLQHPRTVPAPGDLAPHLQLHPATALLPFNHGTHLHAVVTVRDYLVLSTTVVPQQFTPSLGTQHLAVTPLAGQWRCLVHLEHHLACHAPAACRRPYLDICGTARLRPLPCAVTPAYAATGCTTTLAWRPMRPCGPPWRTHAHAAVSHSR